MSFSISRARRTLSACSVVLLTAAIGVPAQEPQPSATQTEVIRISTELVQTGVIVLDKQGRFVEGLKPEEFQLRVDGKPVTPAFFEHVVTGSLIEQKLEAAAARGSGSLPTRDAITTSHRGRTIMFFIDDLHLSAESVTRTRKAILEFIDKQMGPDDRVAIASPSGQIGFLQQFTEVKPVLRAAVARLSYRPYSVRDAEQVPMTEYSALRIEQGDKQATDYYAEQVLRSTNFGVPGGLGPPSGGPAGGSTPPPRTAGLTREMAARHVKERAMVMLRQSAAITINTLGALESLMRTSAQLPGRKVVFLISDGFYLNDRNTGFGEKVKQIIDSAVRSGVVIYAMDARGIVSMTDASSNRADTDGRLSASNVGELSASQDPLTALSADTGGRANLNPGPLTPAVNDALKETSNYYLLAWRPTDEDGKSDFKKIEVSLAGRPELTVRLPRGFLRSAAKNSASGKDAPVVSEAAVPAASAPKGTEAALMAALGASTAREGLPTKLSATFLDVPGTGPVLTASMQMAAGVLSHGDDGKQAAAIDILGVVLNDLGKQTGSFKNRVNVTPSSLTAGEASTVTYNHKLPLKPGLYQVRVATRDHNSGRVGSAAQWIEIPDLSSKRLTLSSLLVGGQFIGANQKSAGSSSDQLQFSVDRRFQKGAHLNFLTLIYNAAGGTSKPDLEAQIKIYRDGKAVVSSPALKAAADPGSDLTRIPYGADVALQTLPAGRYLLHVTISDRIAKTTAEQQIGFEIE